MTDEPRDVLLLGSFPADTAEEAFRSMSAILGERAGRLPDGEVGDRQMWIGWQESVLKGHPQFEDIRDDPSRRAEHRRMPDGTSIPPRYRLRHGVPDGDVALDKLGYADAARRSYADFARLKAAGDIPKTTRFQVSLPTTIAFLEHLVVTEAQPIVEPAHETRLHAEVREIAQFVPPGELAIQWDVSKEMAIWEGVWPIYFDDVKQGIVERLARHGDAVPAHVEMGYHFCYGDFGHRHWKEPEDTANMVEAANGVSAVLSRAIDWIHMPVPRERDDDAYFAPLAHLELRAETALYLGLVHHTGGIEATHRRMDAAKKYAADFGVATECGLGRRPAETIPELLAIHLAASVY